LVATEAPIEQCVCKQGEGEGFAIDGDRPLAISNGFLAIRMVQEQFADWSHRIDASGCTLEYNLISFRPTLQNRFGSISAKSAGIGETCERGEETYIDNQQ
jgi:hypothetical protein